TLRSAALKKSLLQRVKLPAARESFDRGDVRPPRLAHRHEAGVDHFAVNDHRTRAALAFAAAFLRPGQPQILAQHVEQPLQGRRVNFAGGAVDMKSDLHSFSIAACNRSGVIGISVTNAPVALKTAAAIAGAAPSIGSSPRPFAPKGPCGYGFSTMIVSISGASSAVGMM